MPPADDAVSADAVLGGRVRIRQPRRGYRVAIDPVLLAAAVAARPGQRVLDVGCGVGAATLCLAARLPGVRVVGLDADTDAIRLAAINADLSGLADRVAFLAGDLLAPPPAITAGGFDHALANPPYLVRGSGRAAANAGKTRATIEGDAGLVDWIRFGVAMLRPRGSLTLIHRADRLGEVLAALAGRAGAVTVLPLWPGTRGQPAKRIIVAARKGSAAPLRLLPGLVLHDPDGRFTAAAEAVLRDAAALPTTASAP